MADPAQDPTIQTPEAEPTLNGHHPPDIEMTDSIAPSPALPHPDLAASTPAAPQDILHSTSSHTSTPVTAPAAPAPTPSARNSPHPSAPAPPTQPIPHGSPTRLYLNQHVTPHLLEAMKHLATTEPDKPLKWLSEFLAQRSAEIEGV